MNAVLGTFAPSIKLRGACVTAQSCHTEAGYSPLPVNVNLRFKCISTIVNFNFDSRTICNFLVNTTLMLYLLSDRRSEHLYVLLLYVSL